MRHDPTAIAIPDRMKSRPVFHGYPVPYATAVIDGTPDFRVSDELKRLECIYGQRCGLCGSELELPFAFMGGELCATNRIYFDPAMHEECARYAMAVCPYFALKDHEFGDVAQVRKKHESKGIGIVDMDHRVEKPKRMIIMTAWEYAKVRNPNDENKTLYCYAQKIRSILWFRWDATGRSVYDHTDTY